MNVLENLLDDSEAKEANRSIMASQLGNSQVSLYL